MAVRIIVRIIVRKDNKILFLRQRNSNGGDHTLPGGKLERNESARDGGVRECFEETGLKIDPKSLKLVHNFFVRKGKGHDSDLFVVFRAKKWSGEIETKEPEKFKKVVWIEKDKISLMNNIVPVARHIINQYLQKIRYSEK